MTGGLGSRHDDDVHQLVSRLRTLANDGPEQLLDAALERAQALVHERPDVAHDLAEAAAGAAERIDRPDVMAQANYVLARIRAERGELDHALLHIERARGEWLRAGQLLSALRTNLGRMQVLDDLGRHDAAIDVGHVLLDALDRQPPAEGDDAALSEWLRATAWNNIGVAHSFLGEHQATVEAYAAAESGYLTLGMVAEAAKTRANRGIELLELGRARAALSALDDARSTFAASGDRMWVAKCSGNIAQGHQQLGEVVPALRELAAARATLADLGADGESARLQAISARVYLSAGLYAEARGESAAAARFLSEAGMRHDAAAAALTCALAALAVGDVDASEPWLREAEQLFEQVGDRQYQAHVTLAAADVARRRGQWDDAMTHARAAVAALRAGRWRVPLADALLRLTDLAHLHGDEQAAADALEEAGALVAELPVPSLRFGHLLRRASQRRIAGDDEAAEQLLRDAVELAEQVGASLTHLELRTAFHADHDAAHDALVDLLVTRGRPGDIVDAERISGRAKSRTLAEFADGAVGAGWRSGGVRPADEAAPAATPDPQGTNRAVELAQRRADLSATYHAMQHVPQPEMYGALQRQAVDLERELTILRLEESAASTRVGELSPGEPARRPAAPPAQTVSYHLVGDDLLVFVRDGDEVVVRRQRDVRRRLDDVLDELAAQWSRFAMAPEFVARHEPLLLRTVRDCLGQLYDLVLAPVADLVGASTGELVVVPHRRLHQVPFGALWDGAAYLVERRTVVLAPTTTPAAGAPSRRAGTDVLVLAVPDAQARSIAAEAAAIDAVLPAARTFLGPEASSALLRAELPGPAIVHLACHGTYRHRNPMFSALRLGDRWLTASEVLEFDLGGALVVLSACESGRHGSDAVEPVGLAWAFLAAGASGVVVSQWPVDDEVTTATMTTLYEQLAAGRDPATALRAAQLQVAASRSHPYHWSAFHFVTPAPPTVSENS